ncbi:unnamed protein product, partial [Plutella xylostella]
MVYNLQRKFVRKPSKNKIFTTYAPIKKEPNLSKLTGL